MLQIVQRDDNDDIFTEHLSKKSGRAQVKKNEQETLRKFVTTVHVSPEESFDRTSPQKIDARGFFSGSLYSTASGQISRSKQEISKMSSAEPMMSGSRTNPHQAANDYSQSNFIKNPRLMQTPELP